ncbi:hypothetical protein E2562_023593 [Oryza meyeriana var. granulata]|uniref:Uncharacterized protein n=1 Tax=Oryza meyeriana var. granulata TaxID=110450 RepID=A0A6G1FBL1_9ORYZ|nr:hypothetical protein E2562_023593 [Oryza meyeriana var. granulata]
MLRAAEEYVRCREAAGVEKRHTHNVFDLGEEFCERSCGFPRLEKWTKELIWSSINAMLDDVEAFRNDFHGTELVADVLRRHGWIQLAPAPQPPHLEDIDVDDDNGEGLQPVQTNQAMASPLGLINST